MILFPPISCCPFDSLLLANPPSSSRSRLLEESGADVRPFIACNPFQPKAPPDTQDGNASSPSDATAFSAAHADISPATSTGAAVLTENARSASRALEAATGTPFPRPVEAVEALGQALPLVGTPLPDGKGDGGDTSGLEEAAATTRVAAATAPNTAAATAPNTAAAAAGTIPHADARVSLLDAVELVLTTGPLSHRSQAGVGGRGGVETEAGEEAGTGAVQGSGGTELVTAARRTRLEFQGFEKNDEVSVATAVSELLKAASAAAGRWDVPLEEQEMLRAWSNAAATSVAGDS